MVSRFVGLGISFVVESQFATGTFLGQVLHLVFLQMLVVVLGQTPAIGLGEVDLEDPQAVEAEHVLGAVVPLLEVVHHIAVE